MVIKPLDEMVKELPPSARQEVRHFVEFLLAKHGRKSDQPLRQDWASELREYREECTSLELQQKSMEWRNE